MGCSEREFHFISKILHFSSTQKNGIYLVLFFLRLQNRNRGLRASFCYASLFWKSLVDLLKSKAKEIHEVYAGENNSLCFTPFLSHLFQRINIPDSLFTFYYILLQNLHQFLDLLLQRHFILVYVAESVTGLSSSAFNTQGVLCIWPRPITLGTLWSNVTEREIAVEGLP